MTPRPGISPSVLQLIRQSEASAAAQPPQAPQQAPATPRHCWIVDGPDLPGRRPGLLLRWTQHPTGWRALVVYTDAPPGGRDAGEMDQALVQAWLPAACLRPTDGS